MIVKRVPVSCVAWAAIVLGGTLPALAMPVAHDVLGAPMVESVQFNTRVRPQMPTGGGGGGGRFPGGGGIFIDPGVLIGPLIEPPRGRRVIIEEYDDDEEPVRPRAKRQPDQRASPPRQPPRQQQARPAAPRLPPVSIPRPNERRYVADEVLVELRAGADSAAVMRRHRLTALNTTRFSLANATIIRARVEGGRTARQVLQDMAGDARIASAQPNYLYALQQEPAKVEPPPTPKPQYVLDRMAIADAHRLAQGAKVKVALIDTGLDDTHPELQGVIAAKFDALGTPAAGTLEHGTALAGAIVAKSTLRGVSPGAELLAARAFGGATASAQGTSFHILQALDWAAEQGARVFNLSFAGPQDRLMARTLEGAQAKKIIAIAAVGNAGPGTPPLYPAAEPSVLAVTATDASDAVFNKANTGRQVAIAAPGVDVIAAAPERNYAFSSGTSIAAAHVSGLVALMLEKNPGLDLAGVRRLLAATAQDLGPRGADPIFGAGRVNAAAAVARAAEEAAKRP